MTPSLRDTEFWLRAAVRNAPKPLPKGVFPHLLQEAVHGGFERTTLLDVVDEWLNYGYCRISDPVDSDITLTPAGLEYFSRRITLKALPED